MNISSVVPSSLPVIPSFSNDRERYLSALDAIDPDVSYSDWIKAGTAAIAAGLTVNDIIDWSSAGKKFKNTADVARAFVRVKPDGAITAGTLIGMAQDHGWAGIGPAVVVRDKKPALSRAAADDSEKHWAGVEKAESILLEHCEPASADHSYILNKRGWTNGLYQVRADSDLSQTGEKLAGWLVAPVSTLDGMIQSLQYIAPSKEALADKSKAKLNMTGGIMAGGALVVGYLRTASTFYLCEGIGVAWSAIRQHKPDEPVAAVVCFGSGNVGKVAALLRERYKDAVLIVIADTGMEQKMEAVCKEVGAKLVRMPEGSASNYDLNDYELKGGDVAGLLAGAEDFEKPVEAERQNILAPIGKLLEQQFIPDFIVKDVLESKAVNLWFGESGSFKSFLAIDMAASICTATLWHGHEIAKPCAVVYLAGEGKQGVLKRFAGWSGHHGVDIGENDLLVLDGTFSLANNGADILRLAGDIEAFQEKTGKRVGAVFIDTFSSFAGGLSEDSNTDVGLMLAALNTILSERLGVSVVVTHHTGHGDKDRARGAYNFRASVDAMNRIRRVALPDGSDGVEIVFIKAKDSEPHKPMTMAMDSHAFDYMDQWGRPVNTLVVGDEVGGTKLSPASRLSDNDMAVLEAITRLCAGGRSCKWGDVSGELRRGPWADRTKDAIEQAVNRGLKKLVTSGRLATDGDSNYSMPVADDENDNEAF